jgi:hypothetical protein
MVEQLTDKGFLLKLKDYIEEVEVSFDFERGDVRGLKELIEDGAMPDLYFEVLRRIAARESKKLFADNFGEALSVFLKSPEGKAALEKARSKSTMKARLNLLALGAFGFLKPAPTLAGLTYMFDCHQRSDHD